MTFLDLFAGVGGFRRGMELAGHKCLGFCEWDKYARMSYISMHCITEEQRAYLATLDFKQRQKEILKEEYLNGEWCSNDIRAVDARNIPKADCWCFGAPCQDFSLAGKRKGLEGDRSSLIREIFRILGEIREEDKPEWLIYENVKGMLSSNRGFDYLSILIEFWWGGYDIEWQLLNSKLHGVPQNRERVYTIGHLRARGYRKVFPISAASGKDCIQGISLIGTRKGYHRNLQTFSPYGVTETLSTCEGGGREHHVALPLFGIDFNVGGQERPIANTIKARYDAGVTNFKQDGTAVAVPVTFANGQVLGKIDVAHCLSAYGPAKEGVNTHQAMNRVCVPIKEAVAKGYSDAYVGDSINLTAINSKTRRGRVGGGVAQTLDTQCAQATLEVIEGPVPSNQSDHPGVMVELAPDCHVYAVWYEKYQCYVAIRKLTPKECFRLQGWTDDYFEKAQFVNSDSQLYKQAGNGVTVNVVYEIAKKMTKEAADGGDQAQESETE